MAKTATSKKATTGVAVVEAKQFFVPKTAQDVPKAIEALKAQLKGLKGNVEESISLDITFGSTNVKDVKTVKELLNMSAILHAKEEAYNKEVVRYGLQNANLSEFSENGKTLEHWEKVFEKAIFELTNNVKIKQIEQAISKLSQHLDAETKLQNDLESIMSLASQPLV